MKKKIVAVLSATIALAGCASGIDSALFSNAAQVHIFTPEEQAGMTPDGAIPTMLTPSEIRESFKNAGKVTKPTGAVNYCGAGMSALVQSRRNAALSAINGACGGKDQYTIRREGSGYIEVSHVGNVRIGGECNRPMSIYFRCNGVQPKPDIIDPAK
ncbi:MAG: hypothetical protein WAT68_01780 [Candidatus Nitrotoga sp.]